MALETCPECNGTVSSDAAACPHCGKKQRKEVSGTFGRIMAVLAVLAVPIFALRLCADPPPSAPAKPVERVKTPEERKHDAHVLRFGPAPLVRLDGSCAPVERHLKKTAHDPESITVSDCTEARENEGGWLVGCNYRGKNSFGAVVLNNSWFLIRQGVVVEVWPSKAGFR